MNHYHNPHASLKKHFYAEHVFLQSQLPHKTQKHLQLFDAITFTIAICIAITAIANEKRIETVYDQIAKCGEFILLLEMFHVKVLFKLITIIVIMPDPSKDLFD